MRGAIIAAAALGLAGCQPAVSADTIASPAPVEAPPLAPAPSLPQITNVAEYSYGQIWKVCDERRAIYVSKAGYSGGIAVVENALECAQ